MGIPINQPPPPTKSPNCRLFAIVPTVLCLVVAAGIYYYMNRQLDILQGDINAWQAAKQADTIPAYQKYLDTQPNPTFKVQAEQNIKTLAIDATKLLLKIVATPADATIKIMNISPEFYQGIRLVPAKYDIQVSKKGFNPERRWVELTQQKQTFDFALSKTYKLGDGLSFTMQSIPSGQFTMGAKNGDAPEKKEHQVNIGSFSIMQTEVTFLLWDACVREGSCDNSPNNLTQGREQHPVVNVSYVDVTEQFIPWLNKKLKDKTGYPFQLPTEAQWEYAARANSPHPFRYSWGDKITEKMARYGYDSNERENQLYTMPVKKFSPNAFGLYDMNGNAYEWVEACWNKHYDTTRSNGLYRAPNEACNCRVIRGGSWRSPSWWVRSASRRCNGDPTKYKYEIGFRLVQAN